LFIEAHGQQWSIVMTCGNDCGRVP